MAANIWVYYKIYLYIRHDVVKYLNGDKRVSFMKMKDLEWYKKLTAFSTIGFLIPVILRMIQKLTVDNFCHYLALVNFVAFNFGYHVHEKAIELVYIPLVIGCTTQLDKARLHLLGIVMVHTFCPLIPNEIDSVIKTIFLAAQVVWIKVLIPDSDLIRKEQQAGLIKMYKWVTKYVIWFVVLNQAFETFYCWVVMGGPNYTEWVGPAQHSVSYFMAIVNQIIFFELFISMVVHSQ